MGLQLHYFLELIFINELSKDRNFLVYLNKNFGNQLYKKIIDSGRNDIWKEINSDLKFLSFYHGVWKGRYKLCDLIKIFKFFKIPLFNLYKNISYLGYRKSLKKEFKSSVRIKVRIKLPRNRKDWMDFFYLLGLLWGDGDVNVFLHNNDKQIQDEAKRICREVFDTDITLRLTKDKFDEEIEFKFFEYWHHEGRRARMGASMMGPDYTQWHGFYKLARNRLELKRMIKEIRERKEAKREE